MMSWSLFFAILLFVMVPIRTILLVRMVQKYANIMKWTPKLGEQSEIVLYWYRQNKPNEYTLYKIIDMVVISSITLFFWNLFQ